MRAFVSASLAAAVAALLATRGLAQDAGRAARDFSAATLTAPPTTGWPTNGGNLYNQRYSPLKAVNRDNVAQLKGLWRVHLNGSGTAPQYSGFAQPIVHNGVAYVSTGANDVFALSIDSGDILWQYAANLDPDITSVCCGWNNKGVAISDDKVFIGQLDGKLVALDRSTGKVAWSIQAERWQEAFSITAAPLYVDGKVIVGFAGGDRGTRSRLKAYDAKDGRLVTRRGRETTTRGSTAARRSGRRRRTIPSSVSCTSLPATPRPITTARSAPATISTPHRCSRSRLRPGSIAGTSSRCITTSGITTP
jgi:quinohemoprotein ethanol dehydrogenase